MFTGQRNIVQSHAKKYCTKNKKEILRKAEQRNTVQSRAKKYCKEEECSVLRSRSKPMVEG